jgi:hypothetical protein
MKEKKDQATESVKIDAEIVSRVRELVKKTRQTIGGFFAIAAEKELKVKK